MYKLGFAGRTEFHKPELTVFGIVVHSHSRDSDSDCPIKFGVGVGLFGVVIMLALIDR